MTKHLLNDQEERHIKSISKNASKYAPEWSMIRRGQDRLITMGLVQIVKHGQSVELVLTDAGVKALKTGVYSTE